MKVKIENCPAICSMVIDSNNSTSRLRASDDHVLRSTVRAEQPARNPPHQQHETDATHYADAAIDRRASRSGWR